MESNLTTNYGPIQVNIYNLWPYISSLYRYTYEVYVIMVNAIICVQEVYTNVCGHNAKA